MFLAISAFVGIFATDGKSKHAVIQLLNHDVKTEQQQHRWHGRLENNTIQSLTSPHSKGRVTLPWHACAATIAAD